MFGHVTDPFIEGNYLAIELSGMALRLSMLLLFLCCHDVAQAQSERAVTSHNSERITAFRVAVRGLALKIVAYETIRSDGTMPASIMEPFFEQVRKELGAKGAITLADIVDTRLLREVSGTLK